MKYLKSLKPVLIVYVLQYIILILLSSIYYLVSNKDLTSFISNELSIILTIINFLIITYLIKKYNIKSKHINPLSYYTLILLGISLSTIFNTTLFIFSKPNKVTIPLYISIISTGFIGPILEEILFRYILFNNLNKFNSKFKSLIIATIIFAVIHLNLIKIIYAFILGIILNITYIKSNNIKVPILIHISANIMSIFLKEFNIYILLLGLISFFISITILKKGRLNYE